jgi:hypothetical protein
MKLSGKTLILALAAVIGASVAVPAPARADWYDGHRYHHGHVPYGWHYNRHLRYYIYNPAYVAVPGLAPGIVIAQPAPPQYVYAAPAPQVVYAQPQPIYVAPAPPPVAFGLGVHIR